MPRPPVFLLSPLLVVPILLTACAASDSAPPQVAEVRCRDAADGRAADLYADYLQGEAAEGRSGGLGWLDFRATQPDC